MEEKIIKDPSAIKILLVEDNKTNQLITKKIISKKGYTCDVANNGLEACKIIEEKERKPDPHSIGIKLPIVEPTIMPIQMRVFEFTLLLYT